MTDQNRADRALAMMGIVGLRYMGIVWLPEDIIDAPYRIELEELKARGVTPDYEGAGALVETILHDLGGFFVGN